MGALFGHRGHLLRVAGLFAAGVLAFLVLQALLVPEGFGVYGHYRAAALEENRDRPVSFAGRAACVECHSDVTDAMKGGRHAAIRCEASPRPARRSRREPGREEGGAPRQQGALRPLPRRQRGSARQVPAGGARGPHGGGGLHDVPRRPPAGPDEGGDEVSNDRRDFLARSGKLLFLTGAAQLAFESVLRGEPEAAELQHGRALVGNDHRHRQVHRLRQLRPGLRAGERRPPGYTSAPGWSATRWSGGHRAPARGLAHGGLRWIPSGRPRRRRKNFFVPKLCNHCADSPVRAGLPGRRHLRQPRWRRAGG